MKGYKSQVGHLLAVATPRALKVYELILNYQGPYAGFDISNLRILL